MQINHFSSLIEIFCAFNLAYVITDNVSSKNYIFIIVDKLLRKYETVDENFDCVQKKIDTAKTSMTSFSPKIVDGNDKQKKDQYEKYKNKLEAYQVHINSIRTETNNEIKDTYVSKSFGYTNTYLMIYCLTILFISGIENVYKPYNYNLYNSILVIFIVSFIFLASCWWYDRLKAKGNKINKKRTFNPENGNGYTNAFYAITIYFVLGIVVYFIPPFKTVEFETYQKYVNGLILLTVMLPISNFIAYFVKANLRTRKNVAKLEGISGELLEKSESQLDEINGYIASIKFSIGTTSDLDTGKQDKEPDTGK